MKDKHFAFSLIELLISLIIISLLLSTLAPVMTRKFSNSINISGSDKTIKAPSDMQCYPYVDANPTVKIPLNNVYYANFIIASGGGGGAGATSETVLNNQTFNKNGIVGEDTFTDYPLTEDMDNFEITNMISGGGGGGGGAALYSGAVCRGSASIDKCECIGQKYDSTNNVCVSNNLGSKNLTNAKTACSNLTPLSKWQLPTMAQLGNWRNQYLDYGIKSGNTVWSKDVSECSKTESQPATCWRAWHSNPDYWHCDAIGGQCCTPSMCSSARHWYDGECTPVNVNLPTTVSCGTNYHYYTLSGSSWNAVTNVNTNTNSRLTYCVYNDSDNVNGEKFYSLSGGGGSSGAAIINDNFDMAVKEKLKMQIDKYKYNGGYIRLIAGAGGNKGKAASNKGAKAGNGGNGGNSCIAILDKNKAMKFMICAKAGNGGSGADASKTNASTDGYGRAGNTRAAEGGCYAKDFTTGEQINFNCSQGGKAAGNGGASTNNPTLGGFGAANVLNNNQIKSTDKNGVSPNSSNNPGAGGSGGSAVKSGFGNSATFAFGNGGNGAAGYVKITYKRKFAGAGGGGGGAGSVVNIKNIYIGKNAECVLTIGKGGAGGNKDNNGLNGGLSSVKCDSDSRIFAVDGGTGGKKGTSAQNISSLPVGGAAGTFGDVNEYIRALEPDKKDIKRSLTTDEEKNKMKGKQNIGGKGQTSGTGTNGGCGGLYSELNICEISDTDSNRINGRGFTYSDTIVPTSKDIQNTNPSYGIAGAGGGGGGWIKSLGGGKGGNGMNGYVCVYWYKQ